MKAKIFLLGMLLCLTNLHVHSQYYYATYGNAADVKLTCGVTTVAMGQGNIMAGVNGTVLHVAHTDVTGNPAPFFNNHYNIVSGGLPMTLTSVQVIEGNATTIVLIGSYKHPSTLVEGFFFMTLSPTGVVGVMNLNPWTGPTVSNMVVNGMCKSPAGEFYVAGAAKYATSGGNSSIFPIAAKFSIAGVNSWARIYTLAGTGWVDQGADIEYYAPTNELYMAGVTRVTSLSQSDAFVMRIIPGTGASGNAYRYGNSSSYDSFIGITTCNSTTSGGVTGLIVAGQTNARVASPVNYDAWAVKIRPTLGILSSQLYDYSPTPDVNNYSSDVVERFNAGVYTYFLTGWTQTGAIGLNDVHVVKINDVLTSTGNFTYGTATKDEFGDKSDIDNAVGNGGLSIFGFTEQGGPNKDFLNVRTYFNGVTACNFFIGTPNTYPGPAVLSDYKHVPVNSVTTVPASALRSGVPFVTICSATSLAAGDNSRISQTTGEIVPPQPLSIGCNSDISNLSAISLTLEEETVAFVKVTGLLGEILFEGEMKLEAGIHSLPNTGDIAPGILVVTVTTSDGHAYSTKVLIR